MSRNIDKQRIHRAAAAMALSNYGHGVDEARVLNWKPPGHFSYTVREAVEDICGHIMETDEHEEMFEEEAKGWVTSIKKAGGIVPFAEQFHWHKSWLLKLAEIEA